MEKWIFLSAKWKKSLVSTLFNNVLIKFLRAILFLIFHGRVIFQFSYFFICEEKFDVGFSV